MHSRWRGSALARATSSLLTVKLVDTLAGADFQPAASLAVLLLVSAVHCDPLLQHGMTAGRAGDRVRAGRG